MVVSRHYAFVVVFRQTAIVVIGIRRCDIKWCDSFMVR